MPEPFNDEYFMNKALDEAKIAQEKGEVPVGAVVVAGGKIIARSHNLTETLNDVTAHAEMIAITAATNFLGGKYLDECILYVTLEPCIMCAGALGWAQLGKVIYGASDDKKGYHKYSEKAFHPKTKIQGGILKNECSDLISGFFKNKR
ncbi:MAG: nucleoside deaminase [Mariniphaga sp.]|nr:nucleoside deaminase [Mariniphaga sp.]